MPDFQAEDLKGWASRTAEQAINEEAVEELEVPAPLPEPALNMLAPRLEEVLGAAIVDTLNTLSGPDRAALGWAVKEISLEDAVLTSHELHAAGKVQDPEKFAALLYCLGRSV